MNKYKYDWIEIFGLPKHIHMEQDNPDNTIRIYPDHVIVSMKVIA